MTNIRTIVTLLSAVTLFGLAWNLVLTQQAYYDVQIVRARGINGAREMLAVGRYRRHWLRALKQFGLVGIWAPRVFYDHPADPVWVFSFGLLLVGAFLYETVRDWSDKKRVKWFLLAQRNHDEHVEQQHN